MEEKILYLYSTECLNEKVHVSITIDSVEPEENVRDNREDISEIIESFRAKAINLLELLDLSIPTVAKLRVSEEHTQKKMTKATCCKLKHYLLSWHLPLTERSKLSKWQSFEIFNSKSGCTIIVISKVKMKQIYNK